MATVTKTNFGTTKNGEHVELYKLENSQGSYVTITNFGGTIISIVVPDQKGNLIDVALGYQSLEGYEAATGTYFGALIGRYGNRISKGHFHLNGKEYQLHCNNGSNHLHGGNCGFSHRLWNATTEFGSLKLTLHSPDMEEGYPGNLDVSVTYSFNDDNLLAIHYEAFTDQDTLVNLTNHSYFNLNGHDNGTIENQYLKIYANSYIPTDNTSIPTGEICSVDQTVFDFRNFRRIGESIDVDHIQLQYAGGYDHTFVLEQPDRLAVAAEAYSKQTGIFLRTKTTLPGIQFYSGNHLPLEPSITKNGTAYQPRQGFALETQVFPDAINHKNFPSAVLRAGMKYDTLTTYEFSIDNSIK